MSDSDHTLHRVKRGWRVGDEDILLVCSNRHWTVRAPIVWATENSLAGALFHTRRDAHRAVVAALAVHPLSSHIDGTPLKMRKCGDSWRSDCAQWRVARDCQAPDPNKRYILFERDIYPAGRFPTLRAAAAEANRRMSARRHGWSNAQRTPTDRLSHP